MISRAPARCLVDPFGRRISYLRLSIVDRCNLRCRYCMPSGTAKKRPKASILRLEEFIEVAEAAAALGVVKFRVTGGEPLMKKGAVRIIRDLVAIQGAEQVLLTTNGQRLAKYAEVLKSSGLSGVNVSLDSLDPLIYRKVTRGGDIRPVIEGIDRARRVDLPVKINAVLVEPPTLSEIARWVSFAGQRQLEIRFIERMGFDKQVPFVANDRILELMRASHTVLPEERRGDSPHVRRYSCDGVTVGFISPRSESFCGGCNKLRLTASGGLRACLASDAHVDIKSVLRRPHSSKEIEDALRRAVSIKPREGPWTAPGRMWQVGG